jgi:hypothetical protein
MRLIIPITKFEKLADGSMSVEGCATSEAVDSQGDILDYEGSKKAFGDWPGNVREAHDPKKPVGKRLDMWFDDETKKIHVKSFVSKGAPETQAKIEDGTLGAYSVGGGNPTKVVMEKHDGKQVRRVLEWPMTELSLVDVGANPDTNGLTLVKADGVATEILAEEVPPAVADAANRFAAAILKAVEPKVETPAPVVLPPAVEPPAPETEKAAAPEVEKSGAICEKCNKVHKEGVEACEKEDLAAAKTETPEQTKADAVETEKTVEAPATKKTFEEWDIRAALDILEGLKSLLFNESVEADAEPPKQRVALETAIENVKTFIASEAAELAATAADGSAPIAAAAQPTFLKALARRLASIEEAITNVKTPGEVPADLFKVHDGDQLAEGIGKGLSAFLDPITKANAELKGLIESEFKDVRKSIVDLGKTAAVPTPLRTVPRDDFAPRVASDNGVLALEKALMSTTNPEAMAVLRQQIAIAKAGNSLR